MFEKKANSFIARYGYLEAAKRYGDMIIEIKDYLKDHPTAAVVNMGCGLDTTPLQCDNGRCLFYNIDFPDVIAARNELLPPGDRETMPPSAVQSAMDLRSWSIVSVDIRP